MRRLGVQGLIFFYLVNLRSCAMPSLDCRIPFFQSRLLRGHALLASPPKLDIFFETRCLVPSCECGSRFCRRWQVPNLLCRLHLVCRRAWVRSPLGEFSRSVFSPGVVEPVPEVERVRLKKEDPGYVISLRSVPSLYLNVRSTVPSLYSNVRSSVPSIYSNVRSSVPSIYSNVRSSVPSLYLNVRSTVPSLYSNVRSTVPSIYLNVRSTVPSLYSNVRSTVPSIYLNVRSTVPSLYSTVRSSVPSLIQNYTNPFIHEL
ncbi:unnamed protein product [Trichogramma brassicae]|uniref:Uncharacterized protein n=1 Tax=Trichogramma brassicae TaxID=86971 RepID=A0A6H5IYK4_9HYME|nr:unnamed protein product [Trichogramma brassicae]